MTKEQEEAILILKRIKMGIKADTQTPNVNVRDVARKKVKAIETVLSMLEEKDKQIDLMAETIMVDDENFMCEFDFKEWETKEEIKQYFENKVQQESDKGATGK